MDSPQRWALHLSINAHSIHADTAKAVAATVEYEELKHYGSADLCKKDFTGFENFMLIQLAGLLLPVLKILGWFVTVVLVIVTSHLILEINMTQESLKSDPTDLISAKLDELIAAVLNSKITAKVGLDATLWNTTDVANYLKVSYRYASEYIVTHHTFPNALRLPTQNKTKGHPRWYAAEVIAWAAKYQEG